MQQLRKDHAMQQIQGLGPAASDDESRRDFLKTAGKLALYTPPAMMLLMKPSRQSLACNSIKPGNNWPNKPIDNGSIDFKNIDWSQFDTTSVDWSKVDLKQVDWNKVDLQKIDWGRIDLNQVEWNKINWKNLDLGKINTQNIDLAKIDWQKIDWQKVDWKKIKIDENFLGNVIQFLSRYQAL